MKFIVLTEEQQKKLERVLWAYSGMAERSISLGSRPQLFDLKLVHEIIVKVKNAPDEL